MDKIILIKRIINDDEVLYWILFFAISNFKLNLFYMNRSTLTHCYLPRFCRRAYFCVYQLIQIKSIAVLVMALCFTFVACKDECKEVNCDPHPKTEMLFIGENCKCYCINHNNVIHPESLVLFEGKHICVEPERDRQMTFIGNKIDKHLLTCNNEDTHAYIFRITPVHETPSLIEGGFRLSFAPTMQPFSFGSISIDIEAQQFRIGRDFSFEVGELQLPLCNDGRAFYHATGSLMDDFSTARIEFRIYNTRQDAISDVNQIDTYIMEFDRLVM